MSKQVTINNVSIPVLVNNRAMVEYERMRGKPSHHISSMEDAIALTYCSLKAGARSAGLKFEMDFEAFIDLTDAHPEIMGGKKNVESGEDTEDKKKIATT